MKITKNRYLATFTIIVVLLALVRLIFPSIARNNVAGNDTTLIKESTDVKDKRIERPIEEEKSSAQTISDIILPSFYDSQGRELKNKINSVPGFSKTFPDNNDVQLVSANKYGVKPVEDRHDAENRKKELVYVGASPYFHVDKLRNSIPYLVPKAAILLNDIGRSYFDSLQIKGIPLHQVIVTSVLRTRDDVNKLRGHNGNATANSCHLYGTTFDICYNRYKTVVDPDCPSQRAVRNDTLKWVLSEVLRDMREKERCYIKYEVKQGCFHITVR